MINLITSFYISNDVLRQVELITSLQNNLNSIYIKKIHLFLDKNEDTDYINSLPYEQQSKINIISIGKQPLYSDLFEYANTLPNEYCMIANGDIWISSILNKDYLMFFLSKNNNIYSLTRYEIDEMPLLIDKIQNSYDAFIFKSQLNPQILSYIKHKQNIWGSENKVISILQKFKYNLYNPCYQFKIIHQHDMTRINRIENNRTSISYRQKKLVFPCIINSNNITYNKPIGYSMNIF